MKEVFADTPYTPVSLASFLLIGLLISGVLISACDSGGSNGDGQSALIPLETGNSWTYEGIVDGVGNATGTISISGTRTINGTEYHAFSRSGESEADYFADKRGDGIFVRNSFDSEEFLLKYPAEDGEIYDYTDDAGVTYQVTVSKQSVEVEAGTFESVRYEIDGPDPDVDVATFAPGVGLIQFEARSDDAELASYDVE